MNISQDLVSPEGGGILSFSPVGGSGVARQITPQLRSWVKPFIFGVNNETPLLFVPPAIASPPFSSSEPQKIYARILDGVIKYPPYLNEAAKSIISKLCR